MYRQQYATQTVSKSAVNTKKISEKLKKYIPMSQRSIQGMNIRQNSMCEYNTEKLIQLTHRKTYVNITYG